MRCAFLFALLVASAAALGAPGNENSLKHDWKQEQSEGGMELVSNHPAPAAYSESGEPEATLAMEAEKAAKDATLPKILESEIADIREGLMIGDYPEEDGHKPDHGIVSYIEEIDGHPVGFIKYRVVGANGSQLDHPRTVIHAILLKDGKVYLFHLIVLYAGHQDEVRGDQMRLVKATIKKG